MSDEQFLARWSRRKQEVRAGYAEPTPEGPEAQGPAPSETVAEPVPKETDLSDLPPIESIDAATDIAAFLRKGIPQELSRAALRRAWSADPAIRDFVGLAENAWDFNDPNAMPGFGPLDCSAKQVDALVRRIVGGLEQAAEGLPISPAETAQDPMPSASMEPDFFGQASKPPIADAKTSDEPAAAELPSSAAGQPVDAGEEACVPRRTHGGALPR